MIATTRTNATSAAPTIGPQTTKRISIAVPNVRGDSFAPLNLTEWGLFSILIDLVTVLELYRTNGLVALDPDQAFPAASRGHGIVDPEIR
jgi:hypothetical protein